MATTAAREEAICPRVAVPSAVAATLVAPEVMADALEAVASMAMSASVGNIVIIIAAA